MKEKMESWFKKNLIYFFIFVGVIIILILFVLPYNSISKYNNLIKSDEVEACIQSQDFIIKYLKAPATAKFSSCDLSDGQTKVTTLKGVIINDTYTNNTGMWTYQIYGYVDSQNGFGALIRANYHVKLSQIGDKWFDDEIEINDEMYVRNGVDYSYLRKLFS